MKRKNCYLCKSINYEKVRNHYHYTDKYRDAANSICNLKFYVHNEISAVFYNASNYDYHFVIKKLAKEFDREFKCLRENTEKY